MKVLFHKCSAEQLLGSSMICYTLLVKNTNQRSKEESCLGTNGYNAVKFCGFPSQFLKYH